MKKTNFVAYCTNTEKCKNSGKKIKLNQKESVCEVCGRKLFVLEGDSNVGGLYFIVGVVAIFVIYQGYDWYAPAPAPAPAPALAPATSQFPEFKRVAETGVLRIGVLQKGEPFYFVGENDVVQGFNYEFVKLLVKSNSFKEFNRDISVVVGDVAGKYEDVPKLLLDRDNNSEYKVDIALDGLTFSDGDLPGVVYSVPYVGEKFGYGVIVDKKSKFKSLKDLSGKKIGVLEGDGDVYSAVKSSIDNAIIKPIPDHKDFNSNGKKIWIKKHIESGEVDAVVYDYPFASAEIKGTNLVFLASKMPNTELKYKIALRDGDVRFKFLINSAINDVKNSEEYKNIERKYFYSDSVKLPIFNKFTNKHLVKMGDTLSSISKMYYGSHEKWEVIQMINNLPNPDFIAPGMVLVLPD